ncbi:ABC transporter permease [Poriferisphaera sp. WC338]|uniref:ABC transporter permease n=1 Tax=Poriferisphaera sp. WC338 TaxID=3425129 RepID=UPI003D813A05
MVHYIVRRIMIFAPMLLAVSLISFVIIQLPPGSYLEEEISRLEAMGGEVSQSQIKALEVRYGLDKPMWEQYLIWIKGIVTRGDFGESFAYQREVNEIIWSFLGYTVLISATSLALVYLLAVPLGCLAAVQKHQKTDHIISGLSFVGMSIPEFLLALLLLVFGLLYLDFAFVGLFSPEFYFQPWSMAKIWDLLKHLPVPAAVVALNGTAGLMRIMRGSMLDVLGQDYIQTARAKGLSEQTVISKHALRMAINPMISIAGMSLPTLLSGSAIISIVLNLPTSGYLLFESLKSQDMYLAGTLILMLSVMLLVGNLIADVALAIADPRIRLE